MPFDRYSKKPKVGWDRQGKILYVIIKPGMADDTKEVGDVILRYRKGELIGVTII